MVNELWLINRILLTTLLRDIVNLVILNIRKSLNLYSRMCIVSDVIILNILSSGV